MIIATAGHVDHGKTALVRALTGQETDRTEEERRRGLSIELGYAFLPLPDGSAIDLVDVPGHARFMRTLVAGVGCVDAVMLVVAADDGAMPQTLEHLRLVSMLGLPLGPIVVTKCARVPAGRAREVAAQLEDQTRSLGFSPGVIHLVDSLDGTGIEALKQALAGLAAAAPPRSPLSPRLLIDRHFMVKGIGQIVTGTLAQGRVSVGDQLRLSVKGLEVRVRGLQVHGETVYSVIAGQRCAVNLTGDLPERIERGGQLLDPAIYRPTSRIDLLLDPPEDPLPRELQLHLGGAVVTARLVPLKLELNSAGGLAMQAVLAQPICCRLGDKLVLRDPAGQRLIAGGRVLDPFAPQRGRNHPGRTLVLQALLEASPAEQLRRLLAELPGMLDMGWYRQTTHLPSGVIDRLLTALDRTDALLRVGQQICRAARVSELAARLQERIEAWHRSHPSQPGANLTLIARELHRQPGDPLLRLALRHGLDAGALVQRGALLCLPDFQAQPDPQTLAWLDELEADFLAAAPRPPVLGDMMQRLGLPRDELLDRLDKLAAQGQLVRVARNRYLPHDSLQQLSELARQLSVAREEVGFTTAEFRDQSGVGRNHSVAILECMDRLGMTRRLPEDRRTTL